MPVSAMRMAFRDRMEKHDGRLGAGGHVLNNTWLAAFYSGNTVVVVLGAGIKAHGLVDGGCQIGLGGLFSQIRA